jgi:hypothetical protein
MSERRGVVAGGVFRLTCVTLLGLGCTNGGGESVAVGSSWSALLDDGDASTIAPGAMVPAPAMGLQTPSCPSGDCSRDPLALWTFDDCNSLSTQLSDTAFTSQISHPAFRAVSVACVAGIDNGAVHLSGSDDIVYAPDQPDFIFDQGLTIAAWIKPNAITGTQSIARKRLDSSSSFVLAIDGRKLNFVLRLTNGRTAAASAPVPAGKFTHVAATYDGKDALLYVNGLVGARAHAVGTIAPGAGPIFVGNDASGRQFKGIVDDVWLNTLAAPADTINGLTCIRTPPAVTLSPGQTAPEVAGTSAPFDLSVTNTNGAACPVDTFEYLASLPFPLTTDAFEGVLSAGPGQTAHATVNVRSSKSATIGSYPFNYEVVDVSAQARTVATLAGATYLVGTGPISCDGSPPSTPLITGSSFSPTNPLGLFTYAGGGLAAPVVSAITSPLDGSLQALQVAANPGTSSDPMNAFLGFGLGFGNPSCLDASAYTGVQFTITGDLGTCQLELSLTPSENNAVANGSVGVCSASACFGPFSGPVTAGTTVVHFADMSGGMPLPTIDPTALNDISWNLTVPTDGVTAPCAASFTVSDVSFVTN